MRHIGRSTTSSSGRRLLPLLLAFLLLLPACSRESPSLFPPEPAVSQLPSATVAPEGELTVSYEYDAKESPPKDVKPLTTRSRDMLNLYSLVYEGLFQLDANMRPQFNLALDAVPSANGTRWTITLRKGVTFHDGTPLTSRDVGATIDALLALETPGIMDIRDYITGYEVLDDAMIEIQVKQPSVHALYALCFPIFPSGHATDTTPAGTGAFRIESFAPAKEIVLVRNESWWKVPSNVTRIACRAYATHDAELAAYGAGEIDLVSTQTLNSARYRESGDTNTVDYLTQDFEFLAPNLDRSLMQDPNVRRAIAYAIDRKTILQSTYLNHGIATDGPMPPDSWLYDARMTIHDYDPDAAKAILEEAGWEAIGYDPNGVRVKRNADGSVTQLAIKLVTNDDINNPERRAAAELIAGQLERVGFLVTLVIEPWDRMMARVEARDFDLLLTGMYVSRIPDLAPLLSADGKSNIMHYSDHETGVLLSEASHSFIDSDYRLAMNMLQRRISDELPFISLYFRTGTLISRKIISGIGTPRELQLYRGLERWVVQRPVEP